MLAFRPRTPAKIVDLSAVGDIHVVAEMPGLQVNEADRRLTGADALPDRRLLSLSVEIYLLDPAEHFALSSWSPWQPDCPHRGAYAEYSSRSCPWHFSGSARK